MTLKLLHSSDIRVGMAFPDAHARADRLREYRLDALKSLVARAGRESVDALLLTGNTFADNRLSHREIKEVIAALRSSTVPVYLLPGLEDPYTPDSPYRLLAELFAPPIRVLGEAAPVRLKGGTLFPCPVTRRRVAGTAPGEDPTGWIPPRGQSDGIRVGLACISGNVGRLAPRDLDFLALGGSTRPSRIANASWSGAPEATTYGETFGHVTLVTIASPGAAPNVRGLKLGRLTWVHWERTVEKLSSLKTEIEALPGPETTLLKLTLRGRLPHSTLHDLKSFLDEQERKLYHLEVENQISVDAQDDDGYHHPLLKGMSRFIHLQASQPIHSGLYDLPDQAEVSRQALIRLGQILEELNDSDLI